MADSQKLAAGGSLYLADTKATIAADTGPEVGLPEQINPGDSEKIVVVYDVPTGTQPTGVELHGTRSQSGVLVHTG